MLYPNLRKLKHCEVVANADLDLPKARQVGRRHGIEQHFGSWEAMAEATRPDGVIVCIGAQAHSELAVALMRAGMHVFVEKPHAPDLESSLKMLSAARECGRICATGYKKRYAPATLRALEVLRGFSGLTRIHIQRSMGGSSQSNPGYLWNWGCHAIDLVEFLAGPPDQVMAWKCSHDWSAVSALLSFPHGAIGELSLSAPGGNWEEVVIQGRGMEGLRLWDGLYLTTYHGNDPCGGLRPSFAASNDGDLLMGFVGELQGFVDAIQTGQQPLGNLARVSHTVALYEAMMRSIAHGGRAEPLQSVPPSLPDLPPLA